MSDAGALSLPPEPQAWAGGAADAEPQLLAAGPREWRVSGDWTLLGLRGRYEEFRERVASAATAGDDPLWDLRNLSRLDTAGALTLWQGWGQKPPSRLLWLPEHVTLFAQFMQPAALPRRRPGLGPGLASAGLSLLAFARHGVDIVALTGRLLLDLLRVLRHPSLIGWREISANVYRTGAQALPITALVGFLVGLTLSYLISKQLKAYGADIFVINILGLAVLRELGPLLAAIIVSGRSGSAMTAQIGVMRVTQELDALSVMGISHTVRLVLPKVVALAISLPLVALWTSGLMLLGGMTAAGAQLGLDPATFLRALPGVVEPANLWLGWSKSVIFGALIALLASHFGLRVKPNTESLGGAVTQSVVTAITLVIVVDAIFAVLFSNVGI
ncbi:phospholipid/cholesterol/gamma-HCH transport system permease protein [Pelomonas aquatica]|uniref:Phospholipid/cholesterol/gamma-HCH transport system permease protein n=1 Tax=Pelomonas aquatica TaxID=431058 RepID=A0ABU1Z666_9BURK|nr:ABC transporter permease [Pelomonas aquatica]MDR7296103.1 phospholipid/cholesterol/gamma-HCH transport system permease protein [Pelomonas aquatica]